MENKRKTTATAAKILAVCIAIICAVFGFCACHEPDPRLVTSIKVGDTTIVAREGMGSRMTLAVTGEIDYYGICSFSGYDSDEECSFELREDLGKTAVLFTCHTGPVEGEGCNRSKMFVLLDAGAEVVEPIAIGKETFCEGDFDGDGILEVMTNYDDGKDCHVLVYDNINGSIVYADPEETMLHRYGIKSRGAHVPLEYLDGETEDYSGLAFESNNYLGLKISYADLEFKEWVFDAIGYDVLHGYAACYDEPEEIIPFEMPIQEKITGQHFFYCEVEPSESNAFASSLEFAVPYEARLTLDGKIESIEFGEIEKIWGPSQWEKMYASSEVDYFSTITKIEQTDDWNVRIDKSGRYVLAACHVKISTDDYDVKEKCIKKNERISTCGFKLLVP